MIRTHTARPGQATARTHQRGPFTCSSCAVDLTEAFYEVDDVPVHSVLLMRTQQEALEFPRDDIRLVHCPSCGLVENAAFSTEWARYSAQYEETQGFSETFRDFHAMLALSLIERFDVRNRTVLEIGCGKGEFLALLCELGGNRGLGFDPAYVATRVPGRAGLPITFVADYYDERYSSTAADVICCKMTLEHVTHPLTFVSAIRRTVGDHSERLVFFQVPNAARIWRTLAFWDVYYEHCCYFDENALIVLFRRAGFNVIDTWVAYDDQYLMLAAVPAEARTETGIEPTSYGRELIDSFAERVRDVVERWRNRLQVWAAAGQRVVLWGGGSKAVAFLTTIGADGEVQAVVDVNPYRQGTFLAGTGHPIIAPDQLRTSPPDVVIIMNRVYRDEIGRALADLGLRSELVTVDEDE